MNMNTFIIFAVICLIVIISYALIIISNKKLNKHVDASISAAKTAGISQEMQEDIKRMFRKLKTSISVALFALTLLIITFALMVAYPYFEQHHFGLRQYKPLVIPLGEHTKMVEGVINNAFYRKIKALSSSGIHTFVINSPGGYYNSAKEIVDVMNKHDDKVSIEGGQCASSCVYIFSYSKNHNALYDSYFLFHSGYTGWNEPDDRFRRALHTVGLGPKIKQSPTLMLTWAAHISPRLKSYLTSCHPDLSITHKGLWLSWEQIHFIKKGIYKKTCNAVMRSETQKWRENVMSGMIYGIKDGRPYGVIGTNGNLLNQSSNGKNSKQA